MPEALSPSHSVVLEVVTGPLLLSCSSSSLLLCSQHPSVNSAMASCCLETWLAVPRARRDAGEASFSRSRFAGDLRSIPAGFVMRVISSVNSGGKPRIAGWS